jgi:hypothetical protein
MKKTRIRSVLCATGLAVAATASFAQAQFTPAAPGTRSITTATTTTTTPIVVRLAEGARVMDIAGAPVGRIENIVMSPVGCAEAALVASTTGRIVPVPWTLVRASEATTAVGVTPAAATFTINVEQARLAQAPSFTRSQLPDMTTTTWLQPSLNFFNVSATGGTGGSSTSISGGAGSTNTSSTATTGSTDSGVSVLGGTNSSSSATSTNATGGTGAGSTIGDTGTGGSSQGRFGTTATGGTNQSRFGGTATRVPTNSSGILPPTGRTNRPDFDQPNTPPTAPDVPPGPPANRPPENRPPENRPPTTTPSVPRSSPSTQP